MIAILFLSKIYDSEAILFSDGKSGLQLFEKRSNLKRGGVPTVSDVWFVAAVTMLLVLYAGSMMQIRYGLMGVFGTQLILLAVPLFLVIYTKRDVKETYGFAHTKMTGYLGGAVLIVGAYLVNLVIAVGLAGLFPESAGSVETVFEDIMSGNILAVFAVIALAPAVCEEMLFRGVILHSLKAKYRVPSSIAITAALFGLYHMSLVKFIPTGLLGLVLCLVVWKTGSIYPAMLMHFINNAISVFIRCYPEQVEKVLPVLYQDTLSVLEALGLCGVGLVLMGIGWVIIKEV